MLFLAEFFGELVYNLPPRNPNLSPLDFFLWSYLKNIVYNDASRSTTEFKKKIEDAIKKIDTTVSDGIPKFAEKVFCVSGE